MWCGKTIRPAGVGLGWARRCGALLILCLLPAAAPAQEVKSPQRGFAPGGSYSVSDVETINTANANLMLRLPLASLPPGRGGVSAGISLRYNSKLWDAQPDLYVPPPGSTAEYNKLKLSDDGGWGYGAGYGLVQEKRPAHLPHPCGSDDRTEADERYFNRYKVKVIFPDGAAHVFYPVGPFASLGDGYFNVDVNGKRLTYELGTTNAGTPHECEYIEDDSFTSGMAYYTTDGTYLRLEVAHDSDRDPANNAWTLTFPDGTRVKTDAPLHDGTRVQRVYDRNDNFAEIRNTATGTTVSDQFGRSVSLHRNAAPDEDHVTAAGFNGAPLRWTVRWKNIRVRRTYIPWNPVPASSPTENLSMSIRVVDSVTLPAEAGGLSYAFGYNAQDAALAADAGYYSQGWGEVSSVTVPSGAKSSYTYRLDGAAQTPVWEDVLANGPTRKELEYRAEYDGVSSPVTERWVYDYQITAEYKIEGCHVTAPDGGVSKEASDGRGNISYSEGPDGTVVERLWADNAANVCHDGGHPDRACNPYVKTEFRSVRASGGALVRTAITDYAYDKNGNLTRRAEYDWVEYGSVHDAAGKPVWGSARPAISRETVNTYYNQTPEASVTPVTGQYFDSAYFKVGGTPRLLNTIKSSEVGDAGGALARTEFFYDDKDTTGNLKEQRNWDSHKGGTHRPLTRPLGLGGADNYVSVANTYDPAHHNVLVSTTDALDVETRYAYETAGEQAYLYPKEVKTAYGTAVEQAVTQEYDFRTGLVTRSVDPNGVATVTGYDALGRPILVIAGEGTPAETRAETVYSDAERRVIERRELCRAGDAGCGGSTKLVSVTHYDQLGRLRLTRELEDATTQSETDETAGIKVQARYLFSGQNSYQLTSNPYRAATSGAADGEATMGWAVTKSDRGGRTVEERTVEGAGLPAPWGANNNATGTVLTSYDANYTTVTDQAGKVRRSSVNALGHLVRVDEPAVPAGDPNQAPSLGPPDAPLQPTSYSYDALSNLRQITQGQQTPRTFVFSSLSRLMSATNPESGTVSYSYDANGNLKTKKDARSVETTLDYDQLNRLVGRTYSNRSPGQPWAPAVTYTYDDPAIPLSRGRLTKVSSSVSETHYSAFDAQGRVTQSKQVTDGQTYVMAYGYDRAGNMISETYPSGRVVTTAYDQAGDIASVAGQKAGEAQKTYASEFSHAAHGAVERVRLGNNLLEHTAFNSRRQPVEIGLGTTSAPAGLFKLEYSYGAANNNGNVHSQTLTAPGLVLQQSYEYDELSRLKVARETKGQAETWKQTYVYDRFGNRRFDAANTTIGLAGDNPTISAANNRINAAGYDYDPAGNLIVKPGFGYAYDAENRMTSADTGQPMGASAYSYDGDGRRVKKVTGSGSAVTVFVYDVQGRIVAEYASAPPQQNGTQYLTSDHLGTPRVVTDADGAVRARRDFLPFGEEVGQYVGGRDAVAGYSADGGLRQKFTGKERDVETGLDYFLARYYSSAQGRFTSPDEFTGGPDELFDFTEGAASNPTFYADITNPQSLNKYQYAYNNVLKYVDPDGHTPRIKDRKDNPVVAVGVGISIHVGNVARVEGNVRAEYNQRKQTINTSQERTQLKNEMRAKSTPTGKAIVGIVAAKHDAKAAAKTAEEAAQSVRRTNPTWNKAGSVAGAAGKVILGVNVAISAISVSIAPEGHRGRVAAREVGSLGGSIIVGHFGSRLGAGAGSIGGPPGRLVGAIAGGLAGAGVGNVAGGRLAEKAYDKIVQ